MEVTLMALSGGNHCCVTVMAPQFVIGRAGDCHLQLDSPLVSRHHCVLTIRERTVAVRDLGSSNGTGVNDGRAVREQVLSDGDTLWVAATPVEVRIRDPGRTLVDRHRLAPQLPHRAAGFSDNAGGERP